MEWLNKVICGDVLQGLRTLPDGCVQTCVCSPPYWNLRDYGTATWEGGDPDCGHTSGRFTRGGLSNKQASNTGSNGDEACRICPKCGAVRVDQQIGLEATPEEYVAKMVEVFREVRRVLRPDGTCWINLGDSYASSSATGNGGWDGNNKNPDGTPRKSRQAGDQWSRTSTAVSGIKIKDMVGIPWMVAFALRSDGWYLRSDCIWCLSGGTWLYTRTQKGDMPMMLKDATRLDPSTVKLWNGEKWTQVSGWSRSEQQGDALEITLRSGERISCTPTHKFPTTKGLLSAAELSIGDCLITTTIPEPKQPRDSEHIGIDTAWLAGLYIAEGSRSEDTIQIAGHAKEDARWERVKKIAESYSGAATRTVDGNKMDIRVYGKILNALIDQFVSGKTAKNKCLNPVCWRYSNQFLRSLLDGYLSGDGCWDANNNRWRLGFTRNYNLERDLRTLAARLGFRMTLNLSSVPYNGDRRPTFRGEIRFDQSGHHNEKSMTEIVKIQKAKCRYVYDVGVADEPHLFALASGVLTHNSKPNPMPESVTDRPTKSHEYLFLLAKSGKHTYWVHREGMGSRTEPAPDYRWVNNLTSKETAVKPPEWRTITEPNSKKKLWTRINLWQGRDYYYDHEAIREERVTFEGRPDAIVRDREWGYDSKQAELHHRNTGVGFGHGTDKETRSRSRQYSFARNVNEQPGPGQPHQHREDREDISYCNGRNKRTVWTIATESFSGAHFATFPTKLVEPCILAGSSPKACNVCGAAWGRVTEKQTAYAGHSAQAGRSRDEINASGKWAGHQVGNKDLKMGPVSISTTTGWAPTCSCPGNDGSGRSIILDPFMGSGTTAKVAFENGRDYVGMELNSEYVEMANRRLGKAICRERMFV